MGELRKLNQLIDLYNEIFPTLKLICPLKVDMIATYYIIMYDDYHFAVIKTFNNKNFLNTICECYDMSGNILKQTYPRLLYELLIDENYTYTDFNLFYDKAKILNTCF